MNIVSTQFKVKKVPLIKAEEKRNYRIRQNSPHSCGKPIAQLQFSPYKTFMKKLDLTPNSKNPLENKVSLSKTKYGAKFEIRKSSKSIKNDKLDVFIESQRGVPMD